MVIPDETIRDIQIFLRQLYSRRSEGEIGRTIGEAVTCIIPSESFEIIPAEGVRIGEIYAGYNGGFAFVAPVALRAGRRCYLVLRREPGKQQPFAEQESNLLNFLLSFVPFAVKASGNPRPLRAVPFSAPGFGMDKAFRARYGLTSREAEVSAMLINGFSNKNIAGQLNISEATVKHHVYNIFNKTGADSRTRLMYLLAGYNASGHHAADNLSDDDGGAS